MNDGSNVSNMDSFIQNGKSYQYFGYCLLLLSEAEKRIQERERQPTEAAKESTSLQGWLRKSQPAGETETLHCDKDGTV